MRILVVDDEVKIAGALKRGLETHGYAVDTAHDGEDGLAKAEAESYDLIILDRMMPKMDGVTMLKNLRERGRTVPVLFLTAKDTVLERAAGLNAGADDYLVKPFSFVELIARVRALLRRPTETKGTTLHYQDVELDTIKATVRRADQDIKLTQKEFALLEYLMQHVGQPVSKQTLIDHVWDFDADVLPNTVEVYVGYLRNKIDKPFKKSKSLIKTKRGFGYVFGEAGAHVS
ncbi:response regulator transcription factor [Candidatus Saccharibacteria bacterium]|nr:response regulator transcription factor [Candidatus Saccharibacteria bacterium]